MKSMINYALVLFVVLIFVGCHSTESTDNSVAFIKGKPFTMVFEKSKIKKDLAKIYRTESDSIHLDEIFVFLEFLQKNHTRFYTLELKELSDDSTKVFVTFIVPKDAEYLICKVKQPDKMMAIEEGIALKNEDGTYSHRTNKFRMQFCNPLNIIEYNSIFKEDEKNYPYEMDRYLEHWWDKYNNKQDKMREELEKHYADFMGKRKNIPFYNQVSMLASITEAYTLLNDIDNTYKTLVLLDSTLSANTSKIQFKEFDDCHLLLHLVSRVPDVFKKTDKELEIMNSLPPSAQNSNVHIDAKQVQVVKLLLDIYEKTQNRQILYEMIARSDNASAIMRSDSELCRRYSDLLYNRIEQDYTNNEVSYFAYIMSFFDKALDFFSSTQEYDKMAKIEVIGQDVLQRYDGFIISQDTTDNVPMFNGNNCAYLSFLAKMAEIANKSGNVEKAKNILLDNMYLLAVAPKCVANYFLPLLADIYTAENKPDSVNYYLAMASKFGNKEAVYSFKKYQETLPANKRSKLTLEQIIKKNNFNIAQYNVVPDVTFHTNKGIYSLQNNLVDYKFVLNLSNRCITCNNSFAEIVQKIQKNFKPNEYHILIINSEMAADELKAIKNQKNIYLIDNNNNDLIINNIKELRESEYSNSLIIQKGKTMFNSSLDIPDYFIETKEILN